LTHHEILALIGPFTARGRHVDLAATDRLERRIVFKPMGHAADCGTQEIEESLTLECLGPLSYQLTRLLTPACGPAARLEAVGPQPAELIARIDAVPPQRHYRMAEAVVVAVSFRLAPADGSLIFTRGAAHIAGLELELDAAKDSAGPAAVVLARAPEDRLRLPPDALAVLGGRWSRLRESGDGWNGMLRLGGREPERSRCAEAALHAAAAHLARTLAERPGRFHERWAVARWRVFGRRLVPLAVCIGLMLCAAAVPKLQLAPGSALRMLIFNAPPLLMILVFCLPEIPIVELPPLPRRPNAASWREERD
jgi:hypothetical protein